MARSCGCHMAPYEEYTWHESHVVWNLPPSPCIHVTHGTWKMNHESERNKKVRGSFFFLDHKKEKSIRWRRGEKEKNKKEERKERRGKQKR